MQHNADNKLTRCARGILLFQAVGHQGSFLVIILVHDQLVNVLHVSIRVDIAQQHEFNACASVLVLACSIEQYRANVVVRTLKTWHQSITSLSCVL